MNNKYQTYKEHIENYMAEACFVYPDEPQQTLFESMRYSLLAGGKRLRPIFVFDFCSMCGGDWKKATAFAVAFRFLIYSDEDASVRYLDSQYPRSVISSPSMTTVYST